MYILKIKLTFFLTIHITCMSYLKILVDIKFWAQNISLKKIEAAI